MPAPHAHPLTLLVLLLAATLTAAPARAETPAERAAQRLLTSQKGVDKALLGVHVYDVFMGDKDVGEASFEVTRVDGDAGECYLLEIRESIRPRGARVQRRATAVIRPDLTVERASEVQLRRHEITVLRDTERRSDGDYQETTRGGGDEARLSYSCPDAALHEDAVFLGMLLVGSAKPRAYEFTTCWGAEEPTPTAFEFGDREAVSAGGERRTLQAAEMVIVRPRPVGFLAPPPDPPVLEEPLWFDPDRGTPVVWSRQDDAGPLRYERRAGADRPVTVGATQEQACALQRPQDPALCYLLAGEAGDVDAALAAIDLPRYADYALASVPGLASSIEAQGSTFGAAEAEDLVRTNLGPLRRDEGELAVPLSAESFTVVEESADHAVLAPVPTRVDLPEAEVRRFCVERDPASDTWTLVYVGRDPLRRP